MVSKCVNPECSTPLQYLREGKVYRVELQEITAAELTPFLSMPAKKPAKRVEHFWLCGECSNTMEVEFDSHQHVSVIPKERPLFRRAAAS